MKTSQKLMDSLKSFKIANESKIKGGIKGVVTWTNGKGVCDIRVGEKEMCDVADEGAVFGKPYEL